MSIGTKDNLVLLRNWMGTLRWCAAKREGSGTEKLGMFTNYLELIKSKETFDKVVNLLTRASSKETGDAFAFGANYRPERVVKI